jgi:hypothetical protein
VVKNLLNSCNAAPEVDDEVDQLVREWYLESSTDPFARRAGLGLVCELVRKVLSAKRTFDEMIELLK